MIRTGINFTTALVLGAAMSFSVLAAGDGQKTKPGDEQAWSGFLGDDAVYEQMSEVIYKNDRKGSRWLSPKLTFSTYKSLLVEPVTMFPKPEPSDQVPAEVLTEIQNYLTNALRVRAAEVRNLSEAPGEGVVRAELAITGVSVKTEGMKAYEVLPVAAVWGGLKAATGNRAQDVHVYVEMKLTDSQTDELLGTAMRTLEGEDLKGKKDKLALEDLKKSLDDAIDAAGITIQTLKDSDQTDN